MTTLIPSAEVARPHWLLEIDAGGRVFRYSDDPLEVTRADGSVVRFLPGLADLEVTVGLGPTTAAISLPGEAPDGTPWALLVARGLDLTACRARLLRWHEGQPLERARAALAGFAGSADYGSRQEPLTFTVERPPWTERQVPSPTEVIDAQTWAAGLGGDEPDEHAAGAAYPRIYGWPGVGGGGVLWGSVNLDVPSTPAYVARYGPGAPPTDLIVIAGHRVGSTEVLLYDTTAGGATLVPVVHSYDDLGQLHAQADITAGPVIVKGNEYWVTWPNTDDGGLPNPEASGPMRGAGQIIADLLQEAGIPVNAGRMAAARGRLDRLRLDFGLLEPTFVDEFIEANLGELFPLIRRDSEEGVWYELFPLFPSRKDATATLVVRASGSPSGAGLQVTREGPYTWSPLEEVANEITLRYCPRVAERMVKVRTITGAVPTPAGQLASGVCATSRARYGPRPLELESSIICDDTTAMLAVQSLAARRALPRRRVQISGGPELEVLEPGSVVILTDPDCYVDAVAVVVSMRLRLEKVSLSLEISESERATT